MDYNIFFLLQDSLNNSYLLSKCIIYYYYETILFKNSCIRLSAFLLLTSILPINVEFMNIYYNNTVFGTLIAINIHIFIKLVNNNHEDIIFMKASLINILHMKIYLFLINNIVMIDNTFNINTLFSSCFLLLI